MNVDQYVTVGKFGRCYGVKGEIIVHSFTNPADNILDFKPLYIKKKNTWVQLDVLKFRYNGKHFLMSLTNYASPETVSEITNCEIAITRSQLKTLNKNEFYCCDLIGMTVKNQNGFEFGKILDILPTGSNDILVVKSLDSTKKYLIPYILEKYIHNVDLNQKLIIADWDPDF
jgi:16S rRNA processing protein RimM